MSPFETVRLLHGGGYRLIKHDRDGQMRFTAADVSGEIIAWAANARLFLIHAAEEVLGITPDFMANEHVDELLVLNRASSGPLIDVVGPA